MTIIIYKADFSPPARATMMLVEILGLKVEFKDVNLLAKEHLKTEYLEKIPKHTIPLMEDDDLIIADSHAIMMYLVSKYGGDHENLYPKDVKTRAMVDQRLFFDATVLFPRGRSVVKRGGTLGAGPTEEQVADIIEGYDITEKYLEKKPYIAGDHLTIADVSCVATISALNSIVEVGNKYVKIHEWWARLEKESWYQNQNEPGRVIFDNLVKRFL